MIISLHPPQSTVFACESRFRALAAGRRFGKTFLACTELVRAAYGPGRVAWYVAPTYKQAKQIAWNPLKQLTRRLWASQPHETDLRIDLITGGTIALRGADNYDNLRGVGLDFVVLDEFAFMAPAAWTEVLRPALSDRYGRALFIGTPQGHNHFYELFQAHSEKPDWSTFRYTTADGGIVPLQELIDVSRELDQRTFRQEYEASFENQGVGLVYYALERTVNVRPLRYDPAQPLFWALDFNVNPMCSVLCQIINERVLVLEELILPKSNTVSACEEFLSRTRPWTTAPGILSELPLDINETYFEMLRQLQPGPLNVSIYGDATGDRLQTSASRTDWQLVKDFFGRHTDRYSATFSVPSSNPPVKDRVNCVNAMLRNHAGQHRLFIDPKCKHLIKDLEQVSWKSDPYGNTLSDLDHSDPMRTHVSDALGYLVSRKFPMRPLRGEMSGPFLC